MNRPYVVDASPLILFGKIARLDLLASLGSEMLVPAAVANEVSTGPDGSSIIRAVEALRAFHVVPGVDVPRAVAQWELGAGESQVLALVSEVPTAEAVIDDLAARKCAKALSCRVIGSVGVVAVLKQRGVLELARPTLLSLVEAGLRISDSLIEQVLREVNE